MLLHSLNGADLKPVAMKSGGARADVEQIDETFDSEEDFAGKAERAVQRLAAFLERQSRHAVPPQTRHSTGDWRPKDDRGAEGRTREARTANLAPVCQTLELGL
ncbi:MAG: hypothetical protein R3F54_17245 [Alphaproteobacteria bacterium]